MDQQQPELALEQHQHHKTTKLVRWGESNDSTPSGGHLPRVRSMEETLPQQHGPTTTELILEQHKHHKITKLMFAMG